MLPVVPMKPQGDKRARLQIVATYIKNGTVLFPRTCRNEIFTFGLRISTTFDAFRHGAGARSAVTGVAKDSLDRNLVILDD